MKLPRLRGGRPMSACGAFLMIAPRETALKPRRHEEDVCALSLSLSFSLSSRGGTVQLRRSVNGQRLTTTGQRREGQEREKGRRNRAVPEYHYAQLPPRRRHPAGQMSRANARASVPPCQKRRTRRHAERGKRVTSSRRGRSAFRGCAVTRLLVGFSLLRTWRRISALGARLI